MEGLHLQHPEVYRVSPDDDINQVLRAVKASMGRNVSLVLTHDSVLLRNEVNLRLLKAYAEEANVTVALVSDDPVTRRRAARYSIPVYDAPEGPLAKRKTEGNEVPNAGEKAAGSTAEKKGQLWRRRLTALVVAIGAVVGLLFTLVPKVEIAISPQYEPMHFVTIVQLNNEVASLTETVEDRVVASATVRTAGMQRVGVAHATGVVAILNAGEHPVVIPAGTELATQNGLVFQTNETVHVPGREVSYFLDVPVGVHSGRAEVRATALMPGTEGNVAAERIRILRGAWDDVTVRNLEPFVGGTDTSFPAVAVNDIEIAKVQAAQALEKARGEYLVEVIEQSPRRTLLDSHWSIDQGTEVSHTVGQVTDEIQATAEAKLQTVWIDNTDLRKFVERTIPDRVPLGYTWERAMGFEVQVVGYDAVQGEVRLQADVMLQPVLDSVRLAQTVAGQPVSEAVAYLQGREDIATAVVHPERIQRLPSWAPWIRIQVQDNL